MMNEKEQLHKQFHWPGKRGKNSMWKENSGRTVGENKEAHPL